MAEAGATTPSTAASPAEAPSAGDIEGQDCVKTIQPTSVKAVRADGTTQDATPNDGLGRRYEFATLGDVHEIAPPPGWRPFSASDQELKTYGFPPRPVSGAALQRWQAHAVNYSAKPSEPRLCQTNQHASVVHDEYSRNWAGGKLVNNTFFNSDGEWYQTAFDAVCPAASAYATWTGLGGSNQPSKPIQSGTDSSLTSLNDIYMFWEMISPQQDTTAILWVDRKVSPGDDVESYVASGGQGAAMNVIDWTQGFEHAMDVTSIAGEGAGDFYDGSTAEYITEPPFGGNAPGGRYYLRKPHLGNTYFPYAVANGMIPIASFSSWHIDEVDASGAGIQGSYWDGADPWNNPWWKCA